jgi:hypothetical protein
MLFVTLGFGGCSHSSAPPAAGSAAAQGPEMERTGGRWRAGSATAQTTPSETLTPSKDIEIVYGPMTSVMDSPRGQQDQAEAAVKNSDLANQLTGLGANVTFRFDKAAGEDVIVKSASGVEIVRVPLTQVDGGRVTDAVSAKLKAAVSGS